MAFPVVAERVSGTSGTATTSHSFSAPAGTVAGNLLLVFWSTATGSGGPASPPTGYTGLFTHGLTGISSQIWYKVATGSDSISFTSGASSTGRYVTLRITGASGVVTGDFSFSASAAANSNPPSHSPAAGSADYLWIAARAGADSTGASAAPSGFSNLTSTPAGSGSFSTSELSSTTATVDPATFTSPSATWLAYTVAVAPGVGGGGGGPSVATRTGFFF